MKVIDLLQRIANGEEVPKKIKTWNIIWIFDEKEKTYFINNTNIQLFYVEKITKRLNDEVEIIGEDKKIETIDPIDYCHYTDTTKNMVLVEKINEIIRFLYKTEKDK